MISEWNCVTLRIQSKKKFFQRKHSFTVNTENVMVEANAICSNENKEILEALNAENFVQTILKCR